MLAANRKARAAAADVEAAAAAAESAERAAAAAAEAADRAAAMATPIYVLSAEPAAAAPGPAPLQLPVSLAAAAAAAAAEPQRSPRRSLEGRSPRRSLEGLLAGVAPFSIPPPGAAPQVETERGAPGRSADPPAPRRSSCATDTGSDSSPPEQTEFSPPSVARPGSPTSSSVSAHSAHSAVSAHSAFSFMLDYEDRGKLPSFPPPHTPGGASASGLSQLDGCSGLWTPYDNTPAITPRTPLTPRSPRVGSPPGSVAASLASAFGLGGMFGNVPVSPDPFPSLGEDLHPLVTPAASPTTVLPAPPPSAMPYRAPQVDDTLEEQRRRLKFDRAVASSIFTASQQLAFRSEGLVGRGQGALAAQMAACHARLDDEVVEMRKFMRTLARLIERDPVVPRKVQYKWVTSTEQGIQLFSPDSPLPQPPPQPPRAASKRPVDKPPPRKGLFRKRSSAVRPEPPRPPSPRPPSPPDDESPETSTLSF